MNVPAVPGPDPRKLVYLSDGVTLSPWTSMWELGLFMVGMTQVYKCPAYGIHREVAEEILRKCAITMAEHGCYRDGETWMTVSDWAWNNGQRPTWVRSCVSGAHAGDVLSWTYAGILASIPWLPDGSLKTKAMDYCAAYAPSSASLKDAEWWAVNPKWREVLAP